MSSSSAGNQLRVSDWARQRLRCPICAGKLDQNAAELHCTNTKCATAFPLIDGIPILINENSSVFTIDEFRRMQETFFAESPKGRLTSILKHLMPRTGVNVKGDDRMNVKVVAC